jgi:hypothetical protein
MAAAIAALLFAQVDARNAAKASGSAAAAGAGAGDGHGSAWRLAGRGLAGRGW